MKGPFFSKSRVIGPALPSIRIYQSRNVDELVVVDVSSVGPVCTSVERFAWIKDVNKFLTMPLSVGGGIRSINQIQYLIQNGADRVILNWSLRNDPSLVKCAVSMHGSQSVVGSIDVSYIDNKWCVYDAWSQKCLDISLGSLLNEVQDLGVGEILLTSYRCEGNMAGFDLDLLKYASDLVKVPLIFSGGAGCLSDFCDLMKFAQDINLEIAAVAASSCFHFTQITPNDVAKSLVDSGFDARLASHDSL